ncbi:uncharacterized protein LOC119774452 [Cyprinodon tularosa]|uniref:uncharacterized protein LOC119774452 n=1 Tax=Cyprinodon tularosa TaxID=77115 RepID=UPI0018E1E88E|nr:uncharacterized protein LOC119774452 [Cyprinodon tularosa]
MTVWIWIGLVIIQLSSAQEPDQNREAQDSDRMRGRGFSLQVWQFVKDSAGDADFKAPQFLCSNTSLSVRFSLIRHSDLRLQDGRRLLLLPDGCAGSIRTFRLWVLLELPFSCSLLLSQMSSGNSFYQLSLLYYDHLLKKQKTAVATCRNPTAGQHLASPDMSHQNKDVTVKLPQVNSSLEEREGGRERRPRALLVNPVRSSNKTFTVTSFKTSTASPPQSPLNPSATNIPTSRSMTHLSMSLSTLNNNRTMTTSIAAKAEVMSTTGSTFPCNPCSTDSQTTTSSFPMISNYSLTRKEDQNADKHDLASTTIHPISTSNNSVDSENSIISSDDQTSISAEPTLTKASTTKTTTTLITSITASLA